MLHLFCLLLFVGYAIALPAGILQNAKPTQLDSIFEFDIDYLFALYKTTYGKDYGSIYELEHRKFIFSENLQYIKEHNKKYLLGEKSFYLNINQFADLLNFEFLSFYTGLKTTQVPTNASTFLPPPNIVLPDEVDWRKEGYVTDVKNQKWCGSSWAFSATGSIEGQHFRKTGNLISLSEQQLVDCSSSFGNEGCLGGLPDNAFEYARAKGGLETENSYPYKAKKDERCRFDKSQIKAKVIGHVDVDHGSESRLQEAVATAGPVSVGIDASKLSFQFYCGGVYDEPHCSSTYLDHGVLVVGYGSESGKDYWLVKNSWGTHWGEEGYIKMSRNNNNQCGIATLASYPLV